MRERSLIDPSFRPSSRRASERHAADLFFTDLVAGGAESAEDAPANSDAGERAVHLPLLLAHRAPGFSYTLGGENCILRWAKVPPGFRGAVDVVVHYHGYRDHNRMTLRNKADHSGLDLDLPGVTRPTLGVVPHGRAFPSTTQPGVDGFSFPAVGDRGGLVQLVQVCLAELGRLVSSSGLRRGRLIVTGHSGGGAALNRLMGALGDSNEVNGFQYYDATYGGADLITAPRSWLNAALERDARALQALRTEWTRYMEESRA